MSRVRRPFVLGLALIALGTACSAGDQPAGPVAAAPFSMRLSGADALQLSGMVMVLPVQAGAYSETAPRYRSDVTPIVLRAENLPSTGGASASINILGALRSGVFRVRQPGSGDSTRPEFFAEVILPHSDGSASHYLVDAGLLTIDQVTPLRGSLRVESSRVLRFPPDAPVGTRIASTSTQLTIEGTLGR